MATQCHVEYYGTLATNANTDVNTSQLAFDSQFNTGNDTKARGITRSKD